MSPFSIFGYGSHRETRPKRATLKDVASLGAVDADGALVIVKYVDKSDSRGVVDELLSLCDWKAGVCRTECYADINRRGNATYSVGYHRVDMCYVGRY